VWSHFSLPSIAPRLDEMLRLNETTIGTITEILTHQGSLHMPQPITLPALPTSSPKRQTIIQKAARVNRLPQYFKSSGLGRCVLRSQPPPLIHNRNPNEDSSSCIMKVPSSRVKAMLQPNTGWWSCPATSNRIQTDTSTRSKTTKFSPGTRRLSHALAPAALQLVWLDAT